MEDSTVDDLLKNQHVRDCLDQFTAQELDFCTHLVIIGVDSRDDSITIGTSDLSRIELAGLIAMALRLMDVGEDDEI